ncbi:MAG TPA: MaoC family dehydratase N-terminal domain-containing protein [Candidatus Dormibacteraeota bacterium]|nr:MaoC family dehydratase N-terminal domain-containing protein [Candidatus Dormibacteraeota bacterium]
MTADPSHVGRRYAAPGQVVDGERARRMAAAIAGVAEAPDGPVPPTFAAVYCLAPVLDQLFADEELGIDLAGLIHGDQSFEWPELVRAGDVVDTEGVIESLDQRRGMKLLRLRVEATRPSDRAVVCRGTSLLIARAAP